MSAMGRTVYTFRMAVEKELSKWKDFQRTLRPRDRERFTELFMSALNRGDAGTMIATPRILDPIVLSAMLDLMRRIEELECEIKPAQNHRGGRALHSDRIDWRDRESEGGGQQSKSKDRGD